MKCIKRRSRPLLGAFVEITLHEDNATVFEKAFARIQHVQERMSAHSKDSDLAKIASEAHRGGVTVDAVTAEVVRLSLEWAKASGGAFDPVRAGVELVYTGRRPCLSDQRPDRTATWLDLQIDGLLISSTRPLALDLGGVAKGYAVDLAAQVIANHGCSGVVNAGGDLRFIGDEERSAFVRIPDDKDKLFELREIPFPALATTGSYLFCEEGRNLDLIDSAQGREISAAISITVFAKTCILADAMTKAVLNLGKEQATAILKKYGCSALVIESHGCFHELP